MRHNILRLLQALLLLPLVPVLGAIKVKSVTEVRDKWLAVTPGRATYYEKEASVAGADWEKGATDASAAFKAGVQAINIEALFKGGIKRAGAAKYERKVKDVGVVRFSQGVSAAGPDFEAGVAPFLDEIAKITLDARGPRGAEVNLGRVRQITVALHKKRLALRAAGAS